MNGDPTQVNEEIRAAIEAVKQNVAEMRAANKQALEQLASKGHVDSELKAKHDALKADFTAKTDAFQNRLDEMERKSNRIQLAGYRADPVEQVGMLERFNKARRANAENPRAIKVLDLGEFRGYRAALNKFLLGGPQAVSGDEMSLLQVGTDPTGGYGVVADTSGELVKLVYESSPLRQLASVRFTTKDALEGKRDLDEAACGRGTERTTPTATATPARGKYRIPVQLYWAMPSLSQQDIEDEDMDVEAWLNEKVSEAISRMQNTDGFTGDGVLGYRGLLTYPSGTPSKTTFEVIQRTKTSANGAFASSYGFRVFNTIIGTLKDQFHANARWLMNRTTHAEVANIVDGQGRPIWFDDFSQGPGGLLRGYPAVRCADMPAMATGSLSIAFGDFKAGYQVLDRRGIMVLRDNLTSKPNVLLYTTMRSGGDVKNFEAIKLMEFSA